MNEFLHVTIKRVLSEVNYQQNPYFTALKNKAFAKDDFLETQIQFFNAVVFFSRPMATLAAKIPTPDLRMEILRNVWEEHGEGDTSLFHANTFIELLNRLSGITQEDIETRALWPEVRIFNTTLIGACVLDDYLIGVGLMGIIEKMFSDISYLIGQGLIDNEWLNKENMVHYALHEKLDIKHSQDFFDVLDKSWNGSSSDQYFIEQGLLLGATLFNNLYKELYYNRKRRWHRNITGPHIRR